MASLSGARRKGGQSKRTLHDVVGPRAVRRGLAGKLDAEDARCSVLGICRSCSPEDVDRPVPSLASVVHLDGAVVLNGKLDGSLGCPTLEEWFMSSYIQCILGKDAFTVGSEWGDGAGNLMPASEVRVEFEADVTLGVKTLAIPEGRNCVFCCRGGREKGCNAE